MSQTTYALSPDAAIAGMLGDPNSDAHIRSYANEEATTTPFGLAMVEGTLPEEQVLKPSAASQTFMGVGVHAHGSEDLTAAGAGTDEMMGILSKGRVWVQVDEAVVAGDPVFFRHTGAAADIGKFRNDADTANADALPGARFVVGGSTLALLELNTP